MKNEKFTTFLIAFCTFLLGVLAGDIIYQADIQELKTNQAVIKHQISTMSETLKTIENKLK